LTQQDSNSGGSKLRYIPATVLLIVCVALVGIGLWRVWDNMSTGLYSSFYYGIPIVLIALGVVVGWFSYMMFRGKD
jgi:hypothetical protein